MNKERFRELYEELKGTRENNGKLVIDGFGQVEYELLYETLIEELAPVMKGDFWGWYERAVRSYIRFRKANARRYDYVCPIERIPIEEHSIQHQLAVFKYYLYRRANSRY